MTPTLIDQLKLAIQVESGEVPLSEVQRRLNEDYISKDRTAMTWNPIASDHTPKNWSLKEYEYRRKPKPLERWMNLDSGGVEEFFKSEEVAKRNADMRTKMTEDTGLGYAITRIAVHMREVTND